MSSCRSDVGEFLSERVAQSTVQVVSAREIQIGVQEAHALELIHIAMQQLGIIGDYWAIIVIVGSFFVYVVRYAWVEYDVHALFNQLDHMAMHQLCGVACGIRRY